MASYINEVMEKVHDNSLPTIELLQKSFPNNETFMISISTLLDPRYVFLIYAPLLFAINKQVGHRMILALTLAEWANQILKWLLAGERPYWYVHERAQELRLSADLLRNETTFNPYSSQQQVHEEPGQAAAAAAGLPVPLSAELRQFPVTCELGAGSPSGHAMVTATVWYILIDAYLKNELPLLQRVNYNNPKSSSSSLTAMLKSNTRKQTSESLATLFWSIYTLMLVAVSLSRVYLACHFPHQCLCGALLGALTARLVIEHVPMYRLKKLQFIQLTAFMFSSALITYALLRLTGFDPLWSVDKAMRWCAKKDYIHLDTTPFFSMMRYLGFCLGSGLAYNSTSIQMMKLANHASHKQQQLTGKESGQLFVRRSICALMAIAFGQLLPLVWPAPKAYALLFYASQFALYTLFSFAIAGPIPRLAKHLLPVAGSQSEGKKIV